MTTTRGIFHTWVKREFRKGYSIPMLPYQDGIMCKEFWNRYDSMLRILPGFDEKTGRIFKQNINCNEYSDEDDKTNYLSDTFFAAQILTKFGPSGYSFISSYRPGSDEAEAYGDDSICAVVASAIVNTVMGRRSTLQYKPIQEWNMWANT